MLARSNAIRLAPRARACHSCRRTVRPRVPGRIRLSGPGLGPLSAGSRHVCLGEHAVDRRDELVGMVLRHEVLAVLDDLEFGGEVAGEAAAVVERLEAV